MAPLNDESAFPAVSSNRKPPSGKFLHVPPEKEARWDEFERGQNLKEIEVQALTEEKVHLIALTKDAENQLANLRAQLAAQQAVSDAQAKALADRNQVVRKRTAITKLQRKWRSRHPPPRQTSLNLTEQSGGGAEHQSALRNKERELRVATRQRQATEHDLQVARADADFLRKQVQTEKQAAEAAMEQVNHAGLQTRDLRLQLQEQFQHEKDQLIDQLNHARRQLSDASAESAAAQATKVSIAVSETTDHYEQKLREADDERRRALDMLASLTAERDELAAEQQRLASVNPDADLRHDLHGGPDIAQRFGKGKGAGRTGMRSLAHGPRGNSGTHRLTDDDLQSSHLTSPSTSTSSRQPTGIKLSVPTKCAVRPLPAGSGAKDATKLADWLQHVKTDLTKSDPTWHAWLQHFTTAETIEKAEFDQFSLNMILASSTLYDALHTMLRDNSSAASFLTEIRKGSVIPGVDPKQQRCGFSAYRRLLAVVEEYVIEHSVDPATAQLQLLQAFNTSWEATSLSAFDEREHDVEDLMIKFEHLLQGEFDHHRRAVLLAASCRPQTRHLVQAIVDRHRSASGQVKDYNAVAAAVRKMLQDYESTTALASAVSGLGSTSNRSPGLVAESQLGPAIASAKQADEPINRDRVLREIQSITTPAEGESTTEARPVAEPGSCSHDPLAVVEAFQAQTGPRVKCMVCGRFGTHGTGVDKWHNTDCFCSVDTKHRAKIAEMEPKVQAVIATKSLAILQDFVANGCPAPAAPKTAKVTAVKAVAFVEDGAPNITNEDDSDDDEEGVRMTTDRSRNQTQAYIAINVEDPNSMPSQSADDTTDDPPSFPHEAASSHSNSSEDESGSPGPTYQTTPRIYIPC